MPRIQEYRQQTNTPSGPRYASIGSVPDNSGAVASAFGALSRGAADLVDSYQKSQEEQARAWSSDVLAKARLDWTQNIMDRKSAATPGAPDFTPNLLKDYEAYVEKTVNSAPTKHAQKYLRERLTEFGVTIGGQAMEFEAKARVDYRVDSFNNAISTTQRLMNTDPNQYQVALAERLVEIDGSSLPPIQKSAIRQKAVDDISLAAVWSKIQKSPGAWLESIGFGAPTDSKTRKFSGDLKGMTGDLAFDALPFDRRSQMFEQAIRLKAQNDSDVNRLAAERKKELADDAMKMVWGKSADRTLRRSDIEAVRPLLGASEYHSALKSLEHPEPRRSDPATFRHLQELLYSDPLEASKFAFKSHKAGLLSDEHLSSSVGHARTMERQEGPKSVYERSRQYIVTAMDPGPFVQDPVGKQRYADAVGDFDSWVQAEKRSDKEVEEYSRNIVTRYKLVSFNDTALSLPMPVNGNIRRNVTNPNEVLEDVARVGRLVQEKLDSGRINRTEYDKEMVILNKWRRAANGGK